MITLRIRLATQYFLNNAGRERSLLFLFIGVLFCISGCRNEQSGVNGRTASSLREFAGAPVRVVWVQDVGDNKDVSARGNQLRLMGYDTEDGEGERVILPGPENFYRPLMTSSGEQIVFSEFHQQRVQVVDWSGKNRRDLTRGRALAVRRDPANGLDWVYVGRSPKGARDPGSTQLYRVQLKNPSIEELVWDKAPFGDAVHVSGDGRRFSVEVAQAGCALIDLDRQESRRHGKGCWPAVAPDQSYRFWFFDGAHRNLEMVDTRQGTRARIHLAGAPGISGHEVYHPRWSNHPRYMVMTGPYMIRQGGNNIRGGGAGVEVYVGRFNPGYTDIEAWFQVTKNQRADFYPDLWVEGVEAEDQQRTGQEEAFPEKARPPEGLSWPVVNKHLLFAWNNAAVKNEWTGVAGRLYQAQILPEGAARFGLNYQMGMGTGWYVANRLPEPDSREYDAVDAVSLAFAVTLPLEEKQADGRLLSLGKEPENQTILRFEQGFLVLEERRAGQPIQITRLGQPAVGRSHVLLQLYPAQVVVRIAGEDAKTYPRKISAIRAWPITLGNFRQTDSSKWNGLLEQIALYNGPLTEQELERIKAADLRMRETAPDIKPVLVKAELVSASSIPSPQDILPYRRGLVADEYRVTELLQGDVQEQNILVARWVILDGKQLPAADRQVGKLYALRLDAFDNRPELEGERLSMDSDNLLLPMYYQVDL